MQLDDIAHAAHEAHRALVLGHIREGNRAVPVQAHWSELDQHSRDRVIRGVQAVLDGATPAELHEHWCAGKRADGWRWGDRKDDTARTHPHLAPYADLPPEQQLKDQLMHAIVGSLAPALTTAI